MAASDQAPPLRVGVAGCGNIAEPYVRDMLKHPELSVTGLADLDPLRAKALGAKYGCRAFESLATMLEGDAVDVVVNLTVHHAHYQVTRQCLEAGKHVHSEKPLALTHREACELISLAERLGLRLGCSPFTFMGEAQETARKLICAGKLGTVRLAYAEVNWGRIETWHPAPQSFYEVGALYDVGVYPLAVLTAIFGPARRVQAYGTVLKADRLTKGGESFRVETPDFMVTMIEFACGLLVRLTTNFYVPQQGKQMGIEFHGDLGSLNLASWFLFDAPVEYAEFGKPYEPVPLVRTPHPGIEWGRAVVDMAAAIAENRPHRADGRQAAHVVEILEAATRSLECGEAVAVSSTFELPAPMDWADGS